LSKTSVHSRVTRFSASERTKHQFEKQNSYISMNLRPRAIDAHGSSAQFFPKSLEVGDGGGFGPCFSDKILRGTLLCIYCIFIYNFLTMYLGVLCHINSYPNNWIHNLIIKLIKGTFFDMCKNLTKMLTTFSRYRVLQYKTPNQFHSNLNLYLHFVPSN
jgi:hypothetical protein